MRFVSWFRGLFRAQPRPSALPAYHPPEVETALPDQKTVALSEQEQPTVYLDAARLPGRPPAAPAGPRGPMPPTTAEFECRRIMERVKSLADALEWGVPSLEVGPTLVSVRESLHEVIDIYEREGMAFAAIAATSQALAVMMKIGDSLARRGDFHYAAIALRAACEAGIRLPSASFLRSEGGPLMKTLKKADAAFGSSADTQEVVLLYQSAARLLSGKGAYEAVTAHSSSDDYRFRNPEYRKGAHPAPPAPPRLPPPPDERDPFVLRLLDAPEVREIYGRLSLVQARQMAREILEAVSRGHVGEDIEILGREMSYRWIAEIYSRYIPLRR